MSEYKPITGELRNSMTYDITTAPNGVSTASLDTSVFCALCDAIDSIHANLERENESLKAELDRARGEWDFWESTHVELPKDADGEPIRIGDMMECLLDGAKKVLRVGYMTYRPDGWHIALIIEDNFKYQSYTPKELRHYHASTVEEVLMEFAGECLTFATCVEDHEVTDAIERFAAKLRLAGDAE